jgi:hypothetical protein
MPHSGPPRRSPGGDIAAGEVYFEFTPIGRQVRVAAIDAATGLEVVILGPATATQHQLEALALRKLQRRLQAEGR